MIKVLAGQHLHQTFHNVAKITNRFCEDWIILKLIFFGLIGLFSDVEANDEPAFEVVLKADKKRLHLLEEVNFSHTLYSKMVANELFFCLHVN